MTRLTVTADWAALERELGAIPAQLKSARFQAVKRTADQGRKMIADRFIEEFPRMQRSKIETGDPTKRKRPITSKVTGGDTPEGVITVSEQPIPLIAFRPTGPGMGKAGMIGRTDKNGDKWFGKGIRQRKRRLGGITVQLQAGRPPLKLRHAFRAMMRSGHEGIYLREKATTSDGKWKPGWNKPITTSGYAARLPIDEQFGPSVYKLVAVPKILAAVEAALGDILSKNIQSQLDRYRK